MKYLSVTEYAQREGISRNTVIKRINAGLEAIRIGKIYAIPDNAVYVDKRFKDFEIKLK